MRSSRSSILLLNSAPITSDAVGVTTLPDGNRSESRRSTIFQWGPADIAAFVAGASLPNLAIKVHPTALGQTDISLLAFRPSDPWGPDVYIIAGARCSLPGSGVDRG